MFGRCAHPVLHFICIFKVHAANKPVAAAAFLQYKKNSMPANLNALIRYKTINGCLSGGRRRWTIAELMEKCAEALAEYRGRYETVSERTIRDDIRVMRSEMLGYNAPIVQERGLYFYSDPDYSIMTIRLTDAGLALQIIRLLEELRLEVSHPELEQVLEKLKQLQPEDKVPASPSKKFPAPALPDQESIQDDKSIKDSEEVPYPHTRAFKSLIRPMEWEFDGFFTEEAYTGTAGLTWGDVLEIISMKN
jgi:hypothetical protein